MFGEIIVPVDGSTFGELAVPRALGIACKSGGEVRLVTVITPLPSSQGSHEDYALESERLDLARERAGVYLEEGMVAAAFTKRKNRLCKERGA